MCIIEKNLFDLCGICKCFMYKKVYSDILGNEHNFYWWSAHVCYQMDRIKLFAWIHVTFQSVLKKSRIRETPTLSTDADNRTDTNLKRLHD